MKLRPALLAASLLLAAGLGWAVKRSSDRARAHSSDAPAIRLEAKIKHVELRPAGDHAQLLVTAIFAQDGQTPVRLEPPHVSLLTADQKPVPRYIGPLLPEPVLADTGPAEITLHYWLPLTDLKNPLALAVGRTHYRVTLPGA